MIPAFRAAGPVGLELPHLGMFWDCVYFVFRMILYFAIIIWAAPWWYMGAIRRNIPFVVAHFGLWLILSLISWAITLSVMDTGLTNEEVLQKFLRHQVMAGPITLLIVLHFAHEIRRTFGRNPDFVPVFWPIRRSDAPPLMANLVDAELPGRVLWITTQNQYINVQTDLGPTLLRRSLAATLQALPREAGVQLHRTAWVARQALHGAHLSADGRSLVMAQGDALPVAQANRDDIAQLLRDVGA